MIDRDVIGYAQIYALGPVIILTLTVLALIVADSFWRAISRHVKPGDVEHDDPVGLGLVPNLVITLIGAGAALVDVFYLLGRLKAGGGTALAELFIARGFPDATGVRAWEAGALAIDTFGLYIALLSCGILIAVSLIMLPYLQSRKLFRAELFQLLVLSTIGMVLLGFSRDLLNTFISIELLSLPLYVLCGLNDKSSASRESSLKYFLLGAFASGFLIYGASLVYGVVGHLNYKAIAQYLSVNPDVSGVLLAGLSLVGVGIAFKLALVPFHAWVPDVYQGAPTPVTAFMASGVKVAMFAAAIRLVNDSLVGLDAHYWRDALAVFAVLSMIIGNLFALHQSSVKRLLAYSAITHTGYLAVALCAGGPAAAQSILVYLVAYCIASLGAFMLVAYLSREGQDDVYFDELHDLSQRYPAAAAALAILVLSMGGLPMTAGFIGKLLVFKDAWAAGLHGLVIIAVLNSVVSFYFYLRFLRAMYMQPRVPGTAPLEPGRMPAAWALTAIFSVVLTILLGVLPQALVEWSSHGLMLQ